MGRGRRGVGRLARGTLVLVPFPFTDLSGQKQRPALVVSPERFDPADVILCAVTSRVPQRLGRWEVPLEARDLVHGRLPKPSVILVGKLFTTYRGLIRATVGRVEAAKLDEVLERLGGLFASP